MNNTILKITKTILQACTYLCFLGIAVFLVTGIYYLFISDAGESNLIHLTEAGLVLSSDEVPSVIPVAHKTYIIIAFHVKAILLFTVFAFLFKEGTKVINSIDSLDTFRTENVRSFQRIGQLFIALFLIHLLGLGYGGEQFRFTMRFEFVYLFCALFSYVLAEIFKEGNRLMEENKLTI